MPTDPGFFEGFYASPFQHPLLLWLAAALAMAFVHGCRGLAPDVRRYCLALGVLSLLDAWLTSNVIPGLGRLPESFAGPVPLFFVLAGDFRFLLLLGAAGVGGGLRFGPGIVAVAFGLTLVVPIVSQLVMWAVGGSASSPRLLFLVYEVSFFLLTSVLILKHPGPRSVPWLRALCRFVLLYYGLWALADAIIMATGSDLGFLVRVIPNVLYYGGLVAAIAWLARQSDEHSPQSR